MGKSTSRERRRRQRERTARSSRRWMLGAGVGIAALVIVVVAVSTSRSHASTTAPDFQMVAYQGQDVLGGDHVDFVSLTGRGKPIVLNFWAGLCPACRQEMPGFQRVYQDEGTQFTMIGVDVGPFTGLGSHDNARQLLSDFHITYPAAYATAADPVRDYGIQGMPTTVFLTPDGKVFDKWTGYLAEDKLRSKIADLLAASGTQS